MLFTSIFTFEGAGLRSPVSIATTLAPTESPTNKMPSGPKASGPADVNGTFPEDRVASGLAGTRADVAPMATAAARHSAQAMPANMMRRILDLLWIYLRPILMYHETLRWSNNPM